MSTFAATLSPTRRGISSRLHLCRVQNAYVHTLYRRKTRTKNKPEARSRKDETPPPPPITIVRQLKEPIEQSRKLITDMETLLIGHEQAQARDLSLFKYALAKIERHEPKRDWYYDQLGIPKAKRMYPTSDNAKK